MAPGASTRVHGVLGKACSNAEPSLHRASGMQPPMPPWPSSLAQLRLGPQCLPVSRAGGFALQWHNTSLSASGRVTSRHYCAPVQQHQSRRSVEAPAPQSLRVRIRIVLYRACPGRMCQHQHHTTTAITTTNPLLSPARSKCEKFFFYVGPEAQTNGSGDRSSMHTVHLSYSTLSLYLSTPHCFREPNTISGFPRRSKLISPMYSTCITGSSSSAGTVITVCTYTGTYPSPQPSKLTSFKVGRQFHRTPTGDGGAMRGGGQGDTGDCAVSCFHML